MTRRKLTFSTLLPPRRNLPRRSAYAAELANLDRPMARDTEVPPAGHPTNAADTPGPTRAETLVSPKSAAGEPGSLRSPGGRLAAALAFDLARARAIAAEAPAASAAVISSWLDRDG
jgi:hypothetical protein